MTDWQDSVQTFGSGFVAYRLMIEGWPHQWVTDPRITHVTGLGLRITYPGLSYEGLRIDERMILREAWPECSGITAKIVPTDANEDTLNSFTRDPRVVATLVDPIVASDTTWTTQPALGDAGVVHLGSEAVFVAIDGTTITRAYWDTEAQDHATVEGGKLNPISVYNWPPTMEGRRAYLYAYGPNDDPDSDGQSIWRGVVKRPPAMESDGVSWRIEIGPITDRFDQNLGASDEIEYRIRGVYHSASCPMVIGITTDYNTATPTMPIVRVWGFYESQDDWAFKVNEELALALASATGNAALIESIVCGYTRIPGNYAFLTRTIDGIGYDDWPLIIRVMDALDGSCWVGSPGDPQLNGEPLYGSNALYWGGNANGEWFFEGLPVAPYTYPLPAYRTLVRGPLYTGEDKWPVVQRILGNYKQNDATWPDNRVYLQNVDGLEVDDVLTVKNGDSNRQMRITSINTGGRYIEVELLGTGGNGLYISSDSKIVPLRVYGENSNWADFIEEIKNQAPAANLGKTPWITSGDVDTSNWASYWADLPFHDYWRHRSYRFSKQVRVRNAFAPELQMTGWMARIALDGRLDVAPMPFISAQRSASRSITDNDILLPSDELVGVWPTWVAQSDGLVNIAKVRLGYDPIEDDFLDAGDYTVRIPQSIAEHKSGDRAATEIEVRSQSATYPIASFSLLGLGILNVTQTESITADEVVTMIMPYLRATSTDYATVTIAVPFSFFDVLIGDIVSVTSAYLPDGFGGRGISNKKAIVLGRAWNLDPAHDEMGTLTLWFARDSGRVSGYAPTGRIGSKTHLGSDSWSVSFSAGNGRNLGWSEGDDGNVLLHFAVDDTVQFVQVDTTTPTIVVGTITSIVDADTCIVQLEESWTPGSDAWNMRFLYNRDEGFTLPLQERQVAYCWIADEDREYLDGNFANFPTAREAI